MKRLLLAAAAFGLAAGQLTGAAMVPAWSQSAKDLKADAKNTGSILTYGMGYGQQRYSPLKQINKDTVKRLVPVWNYSLSDTRGQESHPIILNGIMFLTTHAATVAINAMTGKEVWKTKVEYPKETPRVACCGIVNRGVAIYQGKLYRTTLDAHVVALDAKTGKVLWKKKTIDFRAGYSQTVTPLIANGVVITGMSGGEYGTRGFIDGWDPATGKHLWRRYTIPGKGEKGNKTWPGNTWKHGGAPTWLTGTYDPKLDLVYWGTGNAGPWNPIVRKGDNLYTSSVLAIRPKTGEIVWHYQFSPNDPFDYDGVNELVLATLNVDGKNRDVVMQANRNGFFYVLDRKSGKLLRANKYVKVTWAKSINMKTGRPIESALTASVRKGKKEEIWPSAMGGKNWGPMAFDPVRKVAFANTINVGWTYKAVDAKLRVGTFYFGAEFAWVWPKGNRGFLAAIDPLTGKSKWKAGTGIPRMGGVLATGGGLVFTGRMTGEFEAYDSDTGKRAWRFQTGSGIIGQPVTWSANGRQYITVLSGVGGVYALFSGDKRLAKVPTGGSVWTFALMPK